MIGMFLGSLKPTEERGIVPSIRVTGTAGAGVIRSVVNTSRLILCKSLSTGVDERRLRAAERERESPMQCTS